MEDNTRGKHFDLFYANILICSLFFSCDQYPKSTIK